MKFISHLSIALVVFNLFGCQWNDAEFDVLRRGEATWREKSGNFEGQVSTIGSFEYKNNLTYLDIYGSIFNTAIIFQQMPIAVGKYPLFALKTGEPQKQVTSWVAKGYKEGSWETYHLIEINSVENFIQILEINQKKRTISGRFQGAYHGINPFVLPPTNELDTVVITNGTFTTFFDK